MDGPTVSNLIKDPNRGIVCDFVAYRKLDQEELLRCYSVFLGNLKRKRPKKGTRFTVLTTIGISDPI